MKKKEKNSEIKDINFPNLKKSSITISIRISEYLLKKLKKIAKKENIPYQRLMKQYLYEKAMQKDKENEGMQKIYNTVNDINNKLDLLNNKIAG